MLPFFVSFWNRPDQSHSSFVSVPARPGIPLQFYNYASFSCFILSPPRPILLKFCSRPGISLQFYMYAVNVMNDISPHMKLIFCYIYCIASGKHAMNTRRGKMGAQLGYVTESFLGFDVYVYHFQIGLFRDVFLLERPTGELSTWFMADWIVVP